MPLRRLHTAVGPSATLYLVFPPIPSKFCPLYAYKVTSVPKFHNWNLRYDFPPHGCDYLSCWTWGAFEGLQSCWTGQSCFRFELEVLWWQLCWLVQTSFTHVCVGLPWHLWLNHSLPLYRLWWMSCAPSHLKKSDLTVGIWMFCWRHHKRTGHTPRS